MRKRNGRCEKPGAAWILLGMLVIGTATAVAQEQPAALDPKAPSAATPDAVAIPQTSAAEGDNADKDEARKKDDEPNSVIKVGPGDLVEVSVYNVPELTTKARVSNDGDLYLPLIDYVHVSGLSLEEAQKVIEKRLEDGGFVRNPHVTIFVDDYASQGITLLGEVGKPGIYPVLGDRRLFDLFSAAGGLTDRASRTVSITHRNQPEERQTVRLARNLSDEPDSNVELRPRRHHRSTAGSDRLRCRGRREAERPADRQRLVDGIAGNCAGRRSESHGQAQRDAHHPKKQRAQWPDRDDRAPEKDVESAGPGCALAGE